MRPKRTIYVEKTDNPRYTDKMQDRDKWVYRVVKTTNTIEPVIGGYLSASQVEQLISGGATVTVTGQKT